MRPGDPLILYCEACFHARIDEKDRALEFLQKAIDAGYHHHEWIRRDPDLNNIRNEAEFEQLTIRT